MARSYSTIGLKVRAGSVPFAHILPPPLLPLGCQRSGYRGQSTSTYFRSIYFSKRHNVIILLHYCTLCYVMLFLYSNIGTTEQGILYVNLFPVFRMGKICSVTKHESRACRVIFNRAISAAITRPLLPPPIVHSYRWDGCKNFKFHIFAKLQIWCVEHFS